jgi:hypothetical protein
VIEVRTFGGKMNYDDNPYRLPKGDYSDALNITRDAQSDNQDEVVSNILGNLNVPSPGTDLQYTITTNVFAHTSINDILFIGTAFYGANIEILVREVSTGNFVLLTSYVASSTDNITDIVNGLIANQTGLPYTLAYASVAPDTLEVTYDTDPVYGYSDLIMTVTGYHYGGVSKTIGNYADKVRNRQYFFNWNDEGYNRISYYDGTTNSTVVVMEDLTDTDNVGVLNFDPSYRINHIDIIYRDEDGDLLFWTDGLNPPSKINVKTATIGAYGIIQRSYIDVAKEPPSTPPYCVYQDNASVTVNNLNNKQFKFKYRYVFDDLEKSVTSAQCEVPIPKDYMNQTTATDPTKNSSIFILMDSGAENVTKIEILGAESLGETYSDFFLVAVLDKSELGILSNNTAQFKFYNDQAYNLIPIIESIQPFDNVPQKAFAQSLPNGNVLDYGAITENYDLIIPDYQTTVLNNNLLSSRINQTALVRVYHVTQPIDALKIVIAGNPSVGDIYTINYTLNGSPQTAVITSSGSTPTTLKSDVFTYFTGLGYSVSNDSDGNQIVSASPDILDVNLPTSVVPALLTQSKDSQFAYDWFSRYAYGVVYFDEKGRTNGVITSIQSPIQTQQYDELNSTVGQPVYLPIQQLEINSRPPIWASYFEIVRTKNLTKSNFLYWVSYRTYKDAIPNQLGNQYAYISISNLTNYLIDNPSIKTLGYEFTPGDRIRFVKLYNGLGATAQKYGYLDNRDYQIVESVINPKINGVEIVGQVIKILLPNNLNSSSFDFGTGFENYLIELYTPAISLSNDNNLYYEFGQKYNIGNSGTTLAYHEGMIQNQDDSLTQPALYNLYKGDSYFKYRSFPREGSMRWKSEAFTGNNPYSLNSTLYSNTNTNTDITPQNTISLVVSGQAPTGSYNALVINSTKVFTFFIKGTAVVVPSVNLSTMAFYAATNTPLPSVNQTYFYSGPLIAGVETTITYSIEITNILGNTQLYHGLSNPPFNNAFFQGTIKSWDFEITINNSILQGIIDTNFSDTYDSGASPNGRAWKYDPNAKQSFNPTLIRFGGEFQIGTTINDVNRFYEENFDVYDRSRGSIQKMFIEGRNQYVFQQFDVGVVTVLTQIVRDTAGNPLSAQSDKLLNKIVYPYIGGYGIGNVPESFAYGKHAKFFVDNNKGVVCRLSTDGITPISILYKMNAFFVPLLANYNSNLNTTIPETGTPTVYGAYDAFTNKYIICMSEIDRDDLSQSPYTIAFLDSRDYKEGFESFYSYYPENIGALNNLLLTFKDGDVWTQDNPIHCNFYGTDYDVYIDTVFNDAPLDKKTYLAIMQTSNVLWHCPSIISQATTGGSPQSTYIVGARFSLLEGQYNAAIPRDVNSPGGLINGYTMKGNYLKVRFQTSNGNGLYYLNSVSLKYINSPLNVR